MPTYEYQCQECEEHFEYVHRMTDPPKTVCETCGGKLKRLVSAPAFHLKGGGWYKDLYSSPKPGADKSGGDKGASSGGDKSESKKSDSGGGDSSASTSKKSSGD